MARSDGRVQPGQRLDAAFSARAWNRAQDAADLVLGDRGGIAVPPPHVFANRVVVKCFVKPGNIPDTSTPFRLQHGSIVDLRSAIDEEGLAIQGDSIALPSGSTALLFQSGVTRVECLPAKPFSAVPYANRRTQASRRFGVVVGGVEMPEGTTGAVVDVCVAGVCVAQLRRRSLFGTQNAVSPAVIRNDVDTIGNLYGIAEDTECGQARLLRWLSEVPESSVVAEGTPIPAGVSTSNTYALILL